MKRLTVDIWSDIACPWCYIGKRRLEQALDRFEQKDTVDVVWHAFELDPGAPPVRPQTESHTDRIARKYGLTRAQAEAAHDRLRRAGAEVGLDLRFDLVRSGNTFDAHRVIHMAAEKGLAGQAKERLLRAYMTEGRALGDREVLIELAPDIGLDAEAVRAMLASDGHVASVRADEEIARASGIGGVPFFVLDRRYAVSGAQPPELLLEVLEKAA